MQYHHYSDAINPPLLHRKEEFVRTDDPSYAKYQHLTKQEEGKGLYEQPSLIGTRESWNDLLAKKGLRLSGHRLVTARPHTGKTS